MLSTAGPVDDARTAVVGWLHARHDVLVDAIFAGVRGDGFDRAGGNDAEYLAGLRGTIAAALEYAQEAIEHGEGWAGAIPVVALEQARRAARLGVSLDTVLRRYVLGHTLLQQYLMEQADRDDFPGERDTLRVVFRAQASALDRLLQAIVAVYEQELQSAGRSPERRRYEHVQRLLDGAAFEGAELDPELGYELGGWHLGVIAVGAQAQAIVRDLAIGLERRLLSVAPARGSVWAWLGGRDRFAFVDVERVLAGAVPRDGVMSPQGVFPPEGVLLALGEPAKGLRGWRLTHQQAQAALGVALRRGGRGGVTFTRYADVALLATALKDEALARALVEIYLSPLDDHRGSGPVLRETLRVYLAAGCQASSAAVKLNVARSTVAKRLRMIEEKLGRTLHPCPAELEVALLLDELNVFAAPEISNVG